MESLQSGLVLKWDEDKARANWQRHDVEFSEVTTVFGDPLAVVQPDILERDPSRLGKEGAT